jgi:hypothetical protein
VITNTTAYISNGKSAGRVVASVCTLVMSRFSLNGTGVSGVLEMRPFGIEGRDFDGQRPIEALAAAETAKAEAQAPVFTAASADTPQTKQHQYDMWAFRGPAPWSYPA